MENERRITILFNGQGDYVEPYKGDKIPPGCFVRGVTQDELRILTETSAPHNAQMRADGTINLRK